MEQLITVFCSAGDVDQMAIIPADVEGGLAVHGELLWIDKKGIVVRNVTSARSYTITHVASGLSLFKEGMTFDLALGLRERLLEEAKRRGFDWTKDAGYVKREGQWCVTVINDYLRGANRQ